MPLKGVAAEIKNNATRGESVTIKPWTASDKLAKLQELHNEFPELELAKHDFFNAKPEFAIITFF